jgi:hypothetical protein
MWGNFWFRGIVAMVAAPVLVTLAFNIVLYGRLLTGQSIVFATLFTIPHSSSANFPNILIVVAVIFPFWLLSEVASRFRQRVLPIYFILLGGLFISLAYFEIGEFVISTLNFDAEGEFSALVQTIAVSYPLATVATFICAYILGKIKLSKKSPSLSDTF